MNIACNPPTQWRPYWGTARPWAYCLLRHVRGVGVAAVLGHVHARALDVGRGAEDAEHLEADEEEGGEGGDPRDLDEHADELEHAEEGRGRGVGKEEGTSEEESRAEEKEQETGGEEARRTWTPKRIPPPP